MVLRSLILLPLRLRCVKFGHFSDSTSNPPEILLSLSSSFLSLFSFGKLATEVRPTLIVLKNSSSSNSSVKPSILPSFDRQLSRTSSLTYVCGHFFVMLHNRFYRQGKCRTIAWHFIVFTNAPAWFAA